MIEILETDNVNLGRQKANTNFETIQTHLDCEENPHGVTAVQAGALPLAAWNTVWDAGQDLNTILTPGTYAAPTNAIAAVCTNLPEGYTASGQAFKLIVETTSTVNFLRQTLIGRTGVMYARTYNVSNAAFGTWGKIRYVHRICRIGSQGGGARNSGEHHNKRCGNCHRK